MSTVVDGEVTCPDCGTEFWIEAEGNGSMEAAINALTLALARAVGELRGYRGRPYIRALPYGVILEELHAAVVYVESRNAGEP